MSKMKVPIPEAEENLIVDYIYMTDLIKNIENDHQAALKLKFKIPEEYRHLIESKIKELRRQLVDLKAKMKELRIKVADPVRVNEEFIEYSYYPCGYEGKMRFWDVAMVYEGF
ncbi:hypothetical protein [Bacillus salipaludis]|uniref:hypothetical protein n=1 Tax=Bacillus salipaludis TaxID=2547811 RepID=UPI002E1A404E|nr:hypothetical protein [Bacillus salipaludis]